MSGAERSAASRVDTQPDLDLCLYRTIRLIRRFEERAIELVNSGVIIGGIHPYIGQEAIAAGVCAALAETDIITSTHRGHGHVLAKGADPVRMMAELAGRSTGLNKGRGGSMHAADFGIGIYGANGIVGAGAAITTGAAWAHHRLHPGSDLVSVNFFGDGAVNQGVFLEALNLAALWRVPAVFICENNGYATTLTTENAIAGSICDRARAFGIPAETVDGMDARAVYAAAARAVERARRGEGPSFVECTTYRFDAHHTWEHKAKPRYRDPEAVAEGRSRDPMAIQGDLLDPAARDGIDAEIEALLDQAVDFAQTSPHPDPDGAMEYLYATGLRGRSGTGVA